MCGLIWFVQIVHYPLLAQVDRARFTTYMHTHIRQTTWVVAPLMLAEVAAALALLRSAGTDATTWISFALLLLIWLSTAFLQVPCHRKLELGKDRAVIRRLVRSNWLRVGAWTARVPLTLSMFEQGIS
ncbi:MAG: hypothetical protein AAF581_18470 [Planctomycetota bacterium]